MKIVLHWRLFWIPGLFRIEVGYLDGRRTIFFATRKNVYYLSAWIDPR